MKKILSLCLSLIMIAMLVPMASLSVSAAEGDDAIVVETGVEYATLSAAINAATAGQTVKLLKDVTTTYSSGDWSTYVTVSSNKSGLVIDFDGHTLYNQWATCFTVNTGTTEAYNTVTFKNGKIIQDADSRLTQDFDFNGLFNLNNYTDCTLDGMILSSGNYIQSHSMGGIVRTANNISALNLTLKNSSILDEADYVEKYADYTQKTASNQCIGYNNGGGANVKIVLDNATLLSQYSEPLNNLNGAALDIRAAHITKVYSNLTGSRIYNNATVADGYYVTNTATGDPIAELLDENRKLVTSEVSKYNELYFLADNNDPLAVDVSMVEGAAIRLNTKTGLRFYAEVDKNKITALENTGAVVTKGMLIAPADLVEGQDLTLETDESNYLNIPYTSSEYYVSANELPNGGIVASIVDMIESNTYSATSGNITRDFVARAYVSVEFNGETVVSYANNYTNAPRSVQFVADAMIQNESSSIAYLAHKELVDRWAAAIR